MLQMMLRPHAEVRSQAELAPGARMKSTEDWDTAVTLAFAAEQSFSAAQLLTSEKIPTLDALRLSYDRYVSSLLAHARFLPASIAAELRIAQSNYARAKNKAISSEDALRMASQLMTILRQMAPLLQRANPRPNP